VSRRRALACTLDQALCQRAARTMHTAFTAWLLRTHKHRAQHARVAVCRAQRLHETVVATFAAWLSAVASTKVEGERARKARWRVQRTVVFSVLTAWASFAASERRARRLTLRFQQRSAHKRLAAALWEWADTTTCWHEGRARLAAMAASRTAALRARLFLGWRVRCDKQRRGRELATRAKLRQQRNTAHVAFGVWVSRSLTARRHREGVYWLAHHCRTRALRAAIRAWREFVAQLWTQRRGVHARLAAVLDRVVSVRAQWLLSVVFDSWRGVLMAARAQEAAVREAEASARHASLAGAWHGWRAHAAASSRRCLRLQALMGRATQATLRQALLTWQAFTLDERAERVRVYRAASFVIRHALVAAFHTWAATAVAKREKRRRLAIMQCRLSRTTSFRVLCAWQCTAVRRRRNRMFVARLRASTCERIVRKGLHAWAFAAEQVGEAQRQRQLGIRTVLGSAFAMWRKASQQQVAQMRHTERILLRWRRRNMLAIVLHVWADRTVAVAEGRMAAERCAQRLQLQSIHAAWAAWVGAVTRSQMLWATAGNRHQCLLTRAFLRCLKVCFVDILSDLMTLVCKASLPCVTTFMDSSAWWPTVTL
jgi:hypothetical protein